jgi:hypothetical protein
MSKKNYIKHDEIVEFNNYISSVLYKGKHLDIERLITFKYQIYECINKLKKLKILSKTNLNFSHVSFSNINIFFLIPKDYTFEEDLTTNDLKFIKLFVYILKEYLHNN